MVLIIEHVEQVAVEGVDVLHLWEVIQYLGELLVPALRRELDLAHVKLPDTLNSPAIVHHSGRLALRLAQHDIYEILCRRDHLHALEVVGRHDARRPTWGDKQQETSRPAAGLRTGTGGNCVSRRHLE